MIATTDRRRARIVPARREGDVDVAHARAVAELQRELRAADRAEQAAVRAERAEARRVGREARLAGRVARRRARAARLVRAGQRVRPVASIALVTAFAMYGQIAYGLEAYSPTWWALPLRLLVAVGAAVAVESIALYVAWHAHDALLLEATATAARLRRASYLIALAVAAVNYSHFADGWRPTPAAVVFALFSASSPWLWGLHTRRAQRIQLRREGHVDVGGATFSLERARAFPLRTWAAKRWAIDHGVVDPAAAWAGYNADRTRRAGERAKRRAARAAARGGRGSGTHVRGAGGTIARLPRLTRPAQQRAVSVAEESPGRAVSARAPSGTRVLRRSHVDSGDEDAIGKDLLVVEEETGRRPARDDIKAMYRIGSGKADRVIAALGWGDEP